MKVYLIYNNKTLVNALLRNPENCCLPLEVEKDLKKHRLYIELISFYEKRNGHEKALQLITNTDSLSSNDMILNYLSKLDNDQLPLIFKYVQPIIKSALGEKNNEVLNNILILFIGEPTLPSTIDVLGPQTIKLDPIKVYGFLKDINQDFARRYLENIGLKLKPGDKQQDINERIHSAYYDRLKPLFNERK